MFAIILAGLLPMWEMQIIDAVADDYGLNREQKALMIAIRRAENGVPPYYFGVANRRCNTYEKQARWTANTIRMRYDGDVEKFSKRWCFVNWRVWMKNVKFFMRKSGFPK